MISSRHTNMDHKGARPACSGPSPTTWPRWRSRRRPSSPSSPIAVPGDQPERPRFGARLSRPAKMKAPKMTATVAGSRIRTSSMAPRTRTRRRGASWSGPGRRARPPGELEAGSPNHDVPSALDRGAMIAPRPGCRRPAGARAQNSPLPRSCAADLDRATSIQPRGERPRRRPRRPRQSSFRQSSPTVQPAGSGDLGSSADLDAGAGAAMAGCRCSSTWEMDALGASHAVR